MQGRLILLTLLPLVASHLELEQADAFLHKQYFIGSQHGRYLGLFGMNAGLYMRSARWLSIAWELEQTGTHSFHIRFQLRSTEFAYVSLLGEIAHIDLNFPTEFVAVKTNERQTYYLKALHSNVYLYHNASVGQLLLSEEKLTKFRLESYGQDDEMWSEQNTINVAKLSAGDSNHKGIQKMH